MVNPGFYGRCELAGAMRIKGRVIRIGHLLVLWKYSTDDHIFVETLKHVRLTKDIISAVKNQTTAQASAQDQDGLSAKRALTI